MRATSRANKVELIGTWGLQLRVSHCTANTQLLTTQFEVTHNVKRLPTIVTCTPLAQYHMSRCAGLLLNYSVLCFVLSQALARIEARLLQLGVILITRPDLIGRQFRLRFFRGHCGGMLRA